jgi:hypothetical protein
MATGSEYTTSIAKKEGEQVGVGDHCAGLRGSVDCRDRSHVASSCEQSIKSGTAKDRNSGYAEQHCNRDARADNNSHRNGRDNPNRRSSSAEHPYCAGAGNNAHTHCSGNAHTRANRNTNAQADRDANAEAHSHTNTRANGHTNAQANRDAHGHTNTHADAENLLLVLMQTV